MKTVLIIVLWLIAGWTANWILWKSTTRMIVTRAKKFTGVDLDVDRTGYVVMDAMANLSSIQDCEQNKFSIPATLLGSFVIGVILWPISFPIGLIGIHYAPDEIASAIADTFND